MRNPGSSSQPPAAPDAPIQSSLPLNRGSIVAIVGGLLALISFFALSYYGFSYAGAGDIGGSITGRDLATISTAGFSQGYAALWLVPIAGIVALVMGLLPLGPRIISQRTSGITFVVAGAVGLLTLIVTYVRIQNVAQGASSFGLSYGFGIGYWLSAIGMIAVIVGGVLVLRSNQS